MALFRKRPARPATAPDTAAEALGKLVQASGQPSLFAHAEFVKQVTCPQGWIPHLLPADGDRLLAIFGLTGELPHLARRAGSLLHRSHHLRAFKD